MLECCCKDIEAQRIERIVVAVQQDELWIRRGLIPHVLDELSTRPREETRTSERVASHLTDLTPRELEIAELIRNGENKKQIARRLLITERTVTAHLTEIFRKLGVDGRLTLALRMSGRAEADSERINQVEDSSDRLVQ